VNVLYGHDLGLIDMNITYQDDVAPHLYRGLQIRAKRMARWDMLYKHNGRAKFWQMAIPALMVLWAVIAYAGYSAL
jgi:hypothetical protein